MLMEIYFRKSVELIPINEIFIADITTDVFKEENFWNITVTIFLDVTLHKNDEPTPCHISSVLYVNKELSISNFSTLALKAKDTYVRTSICLKIPMVCQ